MITGYRADGRSAPPRLRVRRRDPDPPGAGTKLALVADILRATPEVVECHRVTGDDCYIAIAYVRDVEHLEHVIDRFTPHGQTTTSIMQSSPVPRRPVVPAGRRRGDVKVSGSAARVETEVQWGEACWPPIGGQERGPGDRDLVPRRAAALG